MTVDSEMNTPKPTTGKDILCNYATYLQKKYQTEVPSISIQWPPLPTDKVFNLAMIEQETTYLREEEFSRRLLHGDVDGAMHEKKEVKLEDIVKPDKKRNVILIEGAPGAGKSTLAWHICQKWSTGELFREFIMIIFMQLRDIAIQSATTLASILFQIERGPKPEEVLAAIKDCDGAHILFVLDGWDEFPPGLHGNSMVKDLICRPANVGMSSRTIIITSRPIASAELRLRYASSRVEIVGFRKAEMKRYFEEAIREPHIVQKLEDHLKLRPVIEASCYLPLNAAIVVHIFLALNYSLPNTLFGVFTSLVLCCITRHLMKQAGEGMIPEIFSLSNLPAGIQEPFNNICALAYCGVRENKATFSKAELQSYGLPTELSTLSLIQAVNSFTVTGKSKSYSFLHLSVQELLAAFHISKISPKEQVKIFNQLFEEPRFSAVFQFYSAFTKLQSEGVRDLVAKIVQQKHELRSSLLRCLYEAQDVPLCTFVSSMLNGQLNFFNSSLSPVDCLSVGYFMNSVCRTTSGEFKVNLRNCGLNIYNVGLLCKEMSNCSGCRSIPAAAHLNIEYVPWWYNSHQ